MPLLLSDCMRLVIVDFRPDDYSIAIQEWTAQLERRSDALSSGLIVDHCSDIRSALKRTAADDPADLCFINLRLPDGRGVYLYELLQNRWPGVPAFLIGDTYNAEDEIQVRCKGALYFCKPADSSWFPLPSQVCC